jgi:hypothetical protein
MKLLRTALIILLAVGSTACFDMFKNLFSPTKPTDTNGDVRSYIGTWTGPTVTPAAQSCGGLMWKITAQSGSQASGDFAATCADGVHLAGTMTATHSDTSIPWAGNGHQRRGDVPLQHDGDRHLPGHLEYRRDLCGNVVQRAGQRDRDDQAVTGSGFRFLFRVRGGRWIQHAVMKKSMRLGIVAPPRTWNRNRNLEPSSYAIVTSLLR